MTPTASKNNLLTFMQSITTTLPKHSKLLITGDFNIDILKTSTKKSHLFDIMQQHNLTLAIENTTTQTRTNLDHIWIHNIDTKIIKAIVLDTYWTDHFIVVVQLQL